MCILYFIIRWYYMRVFKLLLVVFLTTICFTFTAFADDGVIFEFNYQDKYSGVIDGRKTAILEKVTEDGVKAVKITPSPETALVSYLGIDCFSLSYPATKLVGAKYLTIDYKYESDKNLNYPLGITFVSNGKPFSRSVYVESVEPAQSGGWKTAVFDISALNDVIDTSGVFRQFHFYPYGYSTNINNLEREQIIYISDFKFHNEIPAIEGVVIPKIEFPYSGKCGENLTWNLSEDGVLNIDGCGEMYDYVFQNIPWGQYLTYIKSINLSVNITKIGSYAFYGCTKLDSIIIPDSVTSIGNNAFRYCSSLKNVTLGSNVKSITADMFDCCSNLESITIPQSVSTIASNAFDSDKVIIHGFTGSIADSYASSNEIAFVSLDGFMANYIDGGQCGDDVFWELYRNGKLIITGTGKMYNSTITTSSYVRDVDISMGITNIGNNSFNGCVSLSNINIPNSVTSIGNSAFEGCSSISNITIPSKVTSIGNSVFEGCSNLSSINLPDCITSIGSYAFESCIRLVDISIPQSVKSINSRAFYNCSKLARLYVSENITSIGSDAFYGCTSLKKIYINDIDAWLNISFSDAESNPLYNGGDLYLNTQLVSSVTITDEINSLKNYTFYNYNGLKSITIPHSVTAISNSSLAGCNNVIIYGYADSCAETTARSGMLPFIALDDGWVPKLSYNGKCGDNLMWQLYQDGKLVINFMNDVTSDMIYDYSTTNLPTWNTYNTLVRSVVFPKGITRVGDFAFDCLTGIVNISYGGDEYAWGTIDIGINNKPLEKAYIVFGETSTLDVNYKDVVKTTAIVNGKVIPVIINLVSGTTWQELKDNLIYSDYTDVIVYDHDGNLIESDDFLSTGYILHHINKDGAVIEEILISVSGDVTGDSIVGVDDVQNVVAHLAGDDIPINKIAIDTNLDDVLTMEELNTFIRSFKERD